MSPFSSEAHFRAEYKLLNDFLVSVPRIKNEKVGKFIFDSETPNPIDISTYVANFESALPKVKGNKAYAISGILRDLPEHKNSSETSAFVGYPKHGISSASDIDPSELQANYFTPNFLRPMPEAEDDPELDNDANTQYDVSNDALYLVPGMLPEPYWDFNQVSNFLNNQEIKKYLHRATKHNLKNPEQKALIDGLKADQELVFHIDMTPSKLPDLVTNNPGVALELIYCMTNT